MRQGNVLGFLAAPSRPDTLRAVSLAVLRVRATGVTFKQIGAAIECCADTVEGAANERSMLSFDALARLWYFWPEQVDELADLWFRPCRRLSVADRFADLHRNLATLEKIIGDTHV